MVVVVAFPLASPPRFSRPREGAAGFTSSSCARAHTTHATSINLKYKHDSIEILNSCLSTGLAQICRLGSHHNWLIEGEAKKLSRRGLFQMQCNAMQKLGIYIPQ